MNATESPETKTFIHFPKADDDENKFPAAMFRKETVHFTCFHTGSVLITGIKSELLLDDVVVPTLLELELL